MPQTIDVPGHGPVEFPDGMSDADIVAAIQQNVAPPVPPKYHIGDLGGLSKTPFSPDLGKVAYNLGGSVTDATGSPALGYAANVATQALAPVVAGKAIGTLAQPVMEGAGKMLMRSALNAPLKDRMSGNAERAVQTLLDQGYNPTMGGADAMRQAASGLGSQVTDITNNSQNVIPKGNIYPYLREKLLQAQTQVNPVSDTNAIRGAWNEFSDSIPGENIPVKLAQALKEGTYKAIGDKSYGIPASSEVPSLTAQKALARGLKEQIANVEPATAPLLAQQSDLLNAAKLAARRGGTDQGLKVGGIAPVAPTTARMIAMLLDKYTLLKSLAARGLYSGAEAIPQAAGATGAALAQGLQQQGQQ